MVDKKEQRELEFFYRFLELAKLPIDPASVHNARPPSSDIRCLTWQGDEVHFEMVELDDFGFRSFQGSREGALCALEEAFEALPLSHPLKAAGALTNALVYVDYCFSAAKVHTRKAPASIFEWLLQVDYDFEGVVDKESEVKLPSHVEAISVYRGKFEGPIFEVSFKGAHFGQDQVGSLLSKKLSKVYSADVPNELVAYVADSLSFHPEVVRARFLRALEGKRDFGPFQRIWLADFRSPNPSAFPLVPTSTDCSVG